MIALHDYLSSCTAGVPVFNKGAKLTGTAFSFPEGKQLANAKGIKAIYEAILYPIIGQSSSKLGSYQVAAAIYHG